MKSVVLLLVSLCILLLAGVTTALADPPAGALPASQEEYFEQHVRPVLVERCQKCHGEEKQKGGLRLDAAAEMAKGGESGPAIVAGNPTASRLIQAIEFTDEPRMPPDGKLPDDAIVALTEWVKLGAPWPAKPTAAAPVSPSAPQPSAPVSPPGPQRDGLPAWRRHWAFRPVVQPPLPPLADGASAETIAAAPIDRFILAALAQKNLAPSPAPSDIR